MRLGITSAVISALIGFFCAAVPLSAAQAQDAQYHAVNGQIDQDQAKAFLEKYREPKAADPGAAAAGMAAAPAMIQAAGLTCTPTEARLIGTVDTSSKAGKVTYKAVETTCKDSLGYILLQGNNDKPTFADCLAAKAEFAAKASALNCTLPANNNTNAAIQAFLQRGHSDCVPVNAAFEGGSDKVVGYEVACQAGTGVILQVGTPISDKSTILTESCYGFAQSKAGQPWPCKLTTQPANEGIVKGLAAKATPPCTATSERFVNLLSDGTENYEFACSDGKGVIIQASVQGKVVRTVPCVQMASSCTLTKVDAAAAAGDFTTKVKAAGRPDCTVAKFQALPLKPGLTQAVEVSCSAGQGGVLVTKDGKDTVFNCGRALAEGYSCSLGPKDAANTALTAQLKQFGKNTCVVSAEGAAASATHAYIEVACSDGAPGYVIMYPRTADAPEDAHDVYTCADAKGMGGCKLPANVKAMAG